MKIAHNKPTIQQVDENAVLATLRSGYIAQGPEVERFENLISAHVGLKHSTVVSNGTTALFLSLWAMGVERGDEVVLPTYVCSALLNAIHMLGAKPVLVDVNLTDFNIEWSLVADCLHSNTKAIIAPHIHGMPTVIPSETFGQIGIIEDCCTAFNSYVDGVHVGHRGDYAVFSFYATKFFTSGGAGGCVSTSSDEFANKVLDYREFDCRETYYPRFNFQVTDVQASMGSSQILRVDEFTRRRNEIAGVYRQFFDSVGVDYQRPLSDSISFNNYRFVLKLPQKSRDKLMLFLHSRDIGCICPIERGELLHNYLQLDSRGFMNAERLAATTLSLPIYPLLCDKELDYIIQTLKVFFR